MRQRRLPLALVLAVILWAALAGCQGDAGGIRYEVEGGSVVIQGYDADHLEYQQEGRYLYFANPRFLGGLFAEQSTEGEAVLKDGRITVRFTRDDDEAGTVFGVSAQFTVETEENTVTEYTFTPWEGKEISMTQEEMAAVGGQLAGLIQNAESALSGT